VHYKIDVYLLTYLLTRVIVLSVHGSECIVYVYRVVCCAGQPLTPSDAKPDMAMLRLIKESELRRGTIIGSGAFGTVYRVYIYSFCFSVVLITHVTDFAVDGVLPYKVFTRSSKHRAGSSRPIGTPPMAQM